MASQGQNEPRTTLAIVGVQLANLQATVNRNHRELCERIDNLETSREKVTDDHEARIRHLEGRKVWGNVADIGAWAAGIGGIISSLVQGKP